MTQHLITLDALKAALHAAALDFLTAIANQHPDETLYGFLFEISPEGFSAHGAAATEEKLSRFAKRWSERNQITLEEARKMFRWESPENAWYQKPDSTFAQVNELLSHAEAVKLYGLYDGTLTNLCLSILQTLDQEGRFGKGDARDRIAIGICYIGGDNSPEEFLSWIDQVNPPRVRERVMKEMPD